MTHIRVGGFLPGRIALRPRTACAASQRTRRRSQSTMNRAAVVTTETGRLRRRWSGIGLPSERRSPSNYDTTRAIEAQCPAADAVFGEGVTVRA